MPFLDGILTLLGSRSYSSVWFWLMLLVIWSMAGRHTIGVPGDLIREVLRGKEDEPRSEVALTLLDWLSLMLPRWRVAPGEGAALVGMGAFLLTFLFLLGFSYGLEMAQALFFLLAPIAVHAGMSLQLAARLSPLLDDAERGVLTPDKAALQAARLMRRHRMLGTAITILAMAITAVWATHWLLMRPFGV